MNTTEVLSKLASGEPLFHELPHISRKRIMGTETEFGVSEKVNGRLPVVLLNGGEMYIDAEHLEYASPEASNAVAAVAYDQAGKYLAMYGNYCSTLYAHNVDWHDSTFGGHENYFTSAPRSVWPKLVPFLIARTIMCGAGWFDPKGAYHISQRARFITGIDGQETTQNRTIINKRHEPLAGILGWERLHVICGDTTMMQCACLLRLGTMSLVVEMLEQDALPDVGYDQRYAISDLHGISSSTSRWYMRGLRSRHRGVVNLLDKYLDRARELYAGRDLVTDIVLAIWQDTLEHLEGDLRKLRRRIDWVAKMFLLEEFQASLSEDEKWTIDVRGWLQSQDLAYHALDPEKGLYMWLAQNGMVERIVSDELIEYAQSNPPTDTRAFARGRMVRYLSKNHSGLRVCPGKWQELIVDHDTDESSVKPLRGDIFKQVASNEMCDPYEPYSKVLCSMQERVAQRHRGSA